MSRSFPPRMVAPLLRYTSMLLFLVASVRPLARCQAPAASLRIEGEVSQPLTLQATDLTAMKHTTIRATDHDGKVHSFSGIPVSDLLLRAGAPLGAQLRGKNMTKYLLIKAKDGYQTLFTLAELDSGYTDRTIILADQVDGIALSSDKGPFRIVVPGEKKHARWTWGVTTFILKSGGE